MIILGIDPGLATTGYSILKFEENTKKTESWENIVKSNKNTQFELIDYGCLVTDKNVVEGLRLKKLYQDMLRIIDKYSPDILTIERLFFFRNAKTIISVGQARGVIIMAAAESKISVLEYAPLEIKANVVGYGRAKKKEVQKSVKEFLKCGKLKLRANEKIKDGHHLDDAVDAIAVALCHTYKIVKKASERNKVSSEKEIINKKKKIKK